MNTMGSPVVSVVIVSHQTRDLLEACLRSIYEHPPSAPFEICVVDNASDDGTREMIRQQFPRVRLVENRDNAGYSRAVNEGFRSTTAPYVLVVNPDMVVIEGAVDALIRFMDSSPRTGVAGGKLLNPDGSLQHSARTFYNFRILLLRRTFLGRLFPGAKALRDHLMLDWDHDDVREVDWLLGACLMIRRSAAKDVGLMDERYFLYFEDVDLCYKMKQRGWGVVYVPDAVMYHHHRRESARRVINRPKLWHLNSVFHFYDKWGGSLQSVKRHRKLVRTIAFLLSDIVAVNLAFMVAYLVRCLLRSVLVKPLFGMGMYLDLLLFINVTTLLVFAALGLYRTRAASWVDEVLAVAKGASASFLVLMAATFMSQTQFYSRTLVAVFWPSVIVLASLGRVFLLRVHLELRGFQFDLRRVLLVGGGVRAMEIQQRIRENPRLGCELVGVLSSEPMVEAYVPVLGRPEDVARIVREMKIHEVILADPGISEEKVAEFLLKSREYGVDVRIVANLSDVLTRTARVEEFLGVPVAFFERSALFGMNAAVKRGLDAIGAVLGLVVIAPVAGVAVLAGRGARFTRWLSGFWEILRGRMSFVGPRAELSCADGAGRDYRPRPGLTGPWATAGLALGSGEKDLLDAFYIQNWSPGMDLRILLESLRKPCRGTSGSKNDG